MQKRIIEKVEKEKDSSWSFILETGDLLTFEIGNGEKEKGTDRWIIVKAKKNDEVQYIDLLHIMGDGFTRLVEENLNKVGLHNEHFESTT